jgi:quercetin dioxygenase-like cupin family protein
MPRSSTTVARATLVLATLLVGAVLGAVAVASVRATPTATRDVRAETAAVGAPGRLLSLFVVTIPPGLTLPKHHHPGTEIGTVLSGRLTYTVYTGSVPVYRTAADGTPVLTRTVKAGTSALLTPGDTVVEQPTDIHRGANRGTKPVRITLAALFRKGAPPSITVK